ncbi:hypothetical protein L7F22_024312 [Adiantum nelumboides]|nr:hypothetical protein [Adiantum nelumboides]
MASSSESRSLLHIKKLEGAHNYAIWQKQCYNVMLQKKQAKPIKMQGVKPGNMSTEEWEEVDELARSTIMLSVSDNLLFNVENEETAWGMWKRLEDLYPQQSAASKVYWLKKLMDLRMKEGTQIGIRARLISLLREVRSNFSAAPMASGEGQSNPSTSRDADRDHNEDFGNEYGPPLPTQEELHKMEHRRLVGEATNLMLNFAKDPKLAKYMIETAFQDVDAQWKATTTSPPKPDSKKQYSEKELEEEVDARLARILGAQKQGKKHDKKRKKSTDFPGYLGVTVVMEGDDGDNFVKVGLVCSTHGAEGELKVMFLTDSPEQHIDRPGIRWVGFFRMGKLVGLRKMKLICGRKVNQGTHFAWLLTFEGVDSKQKASKLVGATILVKDADRSNFSADQFNFPELIGRSVQMKVNSLITDEEKESLRRQRISLANKGRVPWNKGGNQKKQVNALLSDEEKEILRRQRISQANKGKVPWNKGGAHSSETKKRIRAGVIERMKDPKIREKLRLQAEAVQLRVLVQDLEELCEQSEDGMGRLVWVHDQSCWYLPFILLLRPDWPHPPSVVMWSIRDVAAIFGTQEDRLRTWAQEMVSGICREGVMESVEETVQQ